MTVFVIIVIDVKLPTKEDLMTINDVVFPEETRIATNIINQAKITIPSSIVLRQFDIEGKAIPCYVANALHGWIK